MTIKETFALAFQNHKKNNFKDAEILYKKILKINPNHFESIFLLGSLSLQTKKFDAAIQLFYKAIEIRPEHANTHYNLGFVFTELGEYQKAIRSCQKAIEIQPNHAEAYYNLGNILKKLKAFQKAEDCYQKTVQIQPRNVKAHNNLGNVFKQLGKFQKAINSYQKAIKIQPNHEKAHFNLGNVYKQLGKFQKAKSFYQKALHYKPENLETLDHLIDLDKRILDSNLKNKINEIMKSSNSTKKNIAYGNFLLSKYEFKEQNYEKEFNYLLKGHQCWFESESKNFEMGVDYWLNELPNIKKLANLNNLSENINKSNNKIKPIFIIGVPRCGSTLVEKVIASGTEHIPVGEETEILNFFVKQKIQQKQSQKSDIENLQEKIIEKYKRKGLIQETSNYTFTDKSLDNFFYINLIKKIFPNAKVINCRRNSLSCIMSILKNNLTGISWAHNLEHLFKYFDIYNKKIENFKKIFPNFIYELQYEKLVNDPETESKKLFKFCNLLWDEKCLKFYKRKDLISQTASNIQIRKPIYKDSAKKYLPYKQLLHRYSYKYKWYY